jgi:hypothetical protein
MLYSRTVTARQLWIKQEKGNPRPYVPEALRAGIAAGVQSRTRLHNRHECNNVNISCTEQHAECDLVLCCVYSARLHRRVSKGRRNMASGDVRLVSVLMSRFQPGSS